MRERQEQWRRFATWELERLRETPDDFRAALDWVASARELAGSLGAEGPGWDASALRWAGIHAALARLRPPR